MSILILRLAARCLGLAVAMMVILGVLFASGCMAPVKTPDAEHNGKVRVERKDQEFELDKSIRGVEIVNRYGDITVKRQDENAVGIHAVVQRLAPTFARLGLHARRDAGILHIEAGYPPGVDADTAGRLDMAVFLPSAIALTLSTNSDRIKVSAREGSVRASSVSGDISAVTRGRLVLHSDDGQIRASALGRHWSGTSRIETASGRIILAVPTFGGITLDAATGGKLSTNFGLSVHPRPGGGAMAHARYGDGGSRLTVNSGSGEIVLEQLVLMGEDNVLPEDDD